MVRAEAEFAVEVKVLLADAARIDDAQHAAKARAAAEQVAAEQGRDLEQIVGAGDGAEAGAVVPDRAQRSFTDPLYRRVCGSKARNGVQSCHRTAPLATREDLDTTRRPMPARAGRTWSGMLVRPGVAAVIGHTDGGYVKSTVFPVHQ